jgi:hypothetical protein
VDIFSRGWNWVSSIDWKPDAVTAAATIILACLTFVLALGTVALWAATRRLVRDARDTSRRQLRAYVGIHGGVARLVLIQENVMAVDASVDFKNWGQTPGYDFRTAIHVDVQPVDAIPFTDYSEPIKGTKGQSIIGPDGTANTGRSKIVTADELTAIGNGSKTIFVWGRIDYTDAFKIPRHFIYRCAMSGNHQPLTANGVHIGNGWPLHPHPLGYQAN